MEAVSDRSPSTPEDGPQRAGTGPQSWRQIFDDLAAGRTAALEALYDAAAPQLYGMALWRTGSVEDASDVVQDVFVRVVEQGVRLAAVRDPKAWLLTVTHRAAVDVTRRRTRRRSAPLEDCPLLTTAAVNSDRAIDAARASRMLAALPAAQRDAIYLRHFAGCSFAEIGAIVGVPKFTAASRYRNGIGRLRKLMEGSS